MVDFKKKLAAKTVVHKTNPIEIYELLDRESDKGPLRPAQEEILASWYDKLKGERDIIVKLNTGQGKTLIGLLMLQSKLNSGNGPSIFVCPNIHLADQTCEQAKKFGIKFCKIDDGSGGLPNDFLEGKSILITHVQKVFHGFSKFGVGSKAIEIGAIVLDDSHACIDHIEQAVRLRIPNDDVAYSKLIELFEDDLELQGVAKLEEIKMKVYDTILPIPHWAWRDKSKAAVKILLNSAAQDFLKYSWPLVKDDIENSRCIVSSDSIEITPYRIPIELFAFYNKAKCRIFMSATTSNDSFFIKGLSISKEVVLNPLTYTKEKWSGEKMVLIPYEISDDLTREVIVSSFAKPNSKRKYGVIALTPSERATKLWEANGAMVVKSAGDNIKNVMIISTKDVSSATGFNDEVEILRKGGLNKLKKNIIAFINEFSNYDLTSLPNEQIHQSLKSNQLMEEDILAKYFEQPYQKKK